MLATRHDDDDDWYHEDRCNGRSICGKCGEKYPNHLTEECEKK